MNWAIAALLVFSCVSFAMTPAQASFAMNLAGEGETLDTIYQVILSFRDSKNNVYSYTVTDTNNTVNVPVGYTLYTISAFSNVSTSWVANTTDPRTVLRYYVNITNPSGYNAYYSVVLPIAWTLYGTYPNQYHYIMGYCNPMVTMTAGTWSISITLYMTT